MDDVEKRMEEIRATAESIDSGGVSEGVDPQAWIYRKDVTWLLDQLTASRQECERLRLERDRLWAMITTPHPGMPPVNKQTAQPKWIDGPEDEETTR